MKMELVLSIVGSFLVIALGINAFFLRGIFSDLTLLKVELARMIERSDAKEARLDKLEINEKDIFNRLNALEKSRGGN